MTRLGLVITIPSGWTNLGQPPNQFETGLLRLKAPESNSFAPTYIDLQGSLGRWPNASPTWVVANAVPGPADPSTVQLNTCSVGSDPAAYYAYTKGSESGYLVLWLHSGNALEVTLHGTGGVDPQAIRDAKAVLGSVTYTAPTPTPS
jgi:hypothetical protein